MKKRILGIAALLAVVAVSLTFTACPPDNDERSVTFINKTSSAVIITFQNAPEISLAAARLNDPPDGNPKCRDTARKTGADLILNTITFENPLIQDGDILIEGSVVGGKQKSNVKGVALAYGTIIFSPAMGSTEAAPRKIAE